MVEVLPNGSIKITTDKISSPNHVSAERMIREIEKMAGGKVETKRNPKAHGHSHAHGPHTHQH